ncbi:MAG: selenium cofactor biosynthesis protein YqeC [Peptococcaceae bacterium]|nr:selenium cofactor biosynthesis protein YqeC [Peptococcaceae bacterium]
MENASLLTVIRQMLPGRQRIALVGAGGKTTTGYSLARELAEDGERVIFTTSTHIFYPAGREFAVGVGEPESPPVLAAVLAGEKGDTHQRRVLPVLARAAAGRKLSGFSAPEMLRVAALWPEHWLIIEADGSKGRPLKAPGDHEPAVGPLAEAVLYVAGLRGVGRHLSEESVHRPERFSQLTGLPLGGTIRPCHVAALIRHPAGGLKHVPPGAAHAVILTGTAGPEDFLMAGALARCLLVAGEDMVVLTDLVAERVAVKRVFGGNAV